MSERHIPALDGLRGVAVTMVFLFHNGGGASSGFLPLVAIAEIVSRGWVGVSLFFVLSGFLITGILWDSKEKSGWLRRFYTRRAFRIFPLYYGALLLMLLAAGTVHNLHGALSRAWVPAVFLQDVPGLEARIVQDGSPLPIYHFWSLAVEEQFYLIWPFLLALQPTRGRALQLCEATFAVSAVFRLGVWMYAPNAWTFGDFLLMRAGEMAAGAWLAIAYRDALWARLVPLARWVAPSGLLVFAVACFETRPARYGPWVSMLGLPAITFCFAGLLVLCLSNGVVKRCMSAGWLRGLGKISYGVYVYHVLLSPVFIWVTKAMVGDGYRGRYVATKFLVSCVGTLVVATVSFYFFERPILLLNKRDASAPMQATPSR